MPDLSRFPAHIRAFLTQLWKSGDKEKFERSYDQFLRSKQAAGAQAQAKPDVRAQAKLAYLNPKEVSPEQKLIEDHITRAYELLNLHLPLKGYEQLRIAQSLAARHFLPVHATELYLRAVLEKQGRAYTGFVLEVALCKLELALHVGLRRGYHASTGEVAFHQVQTMTHSHLWPNVSPETRRKRLYRAINVLEADKFLSALSRYGNVKKIEVDAEGNKIDRGWMYDGTVFNVRLRGGRVRPLNRDDLAIPEYRDLGADIRSGHTAEQHLRRQMSQPKDTVEGLVSKKELKEWALPPVLKAPESVNDWDIDPNRVYAVLQNALQDIKFCPDSTRMQFIGAAAGVVSKSLHDAHSREQYFELFGGARVLLERGVNRFDQLQREIAAVAYDYGAGKVRNPGAALISNLKNSGLYQELTEAWRGRSWKSGAPPNEGEEGQ